MTKEEWNKSIDVCGMILFAKPSDRKVRLFACACCRYVWYYLTKNARFAIEAAEEYADKRISLREMLSWKNGISENGDANLAVFYACYDLNTHPYVDNYYYVMNSIYSLLDFYTITYIGSLIDRRQYEMGRMANLFRHMVKYEEINHARN